MGPFFSAPILYVEDVIIVERDHTVAPKNHRSLIPILVDFIEGYERLFLRAQVHVKETRDGMILNVLEQQRVMGNDWKRCLPKDRQIEDYETRVGGACTGVVIDLEGVAFSRRVR